MLDVIGELFCLLILRFSRNTPQDKTSCLLSFDDMIEVFNQLAIFVAKKNFSKNFWDTESFLKQTRPKYVKWQQAWKNRIKHYTPRNKPVYDEVTVEGIIETWDTKIAKGTPPHPFPDEAQALYSGFQHQYERPVSIEEVRRYPSVGRNA